MVHLAIASLPPLLETGSCLWQLEPQKARSGKQAGTAPGVAFWFHSTGVGVTSTFLWHPLPLCFFYVGTALTLFPVGAATAIALVNKMQAKVQGTTSRGSIELPVLDLSACSSLVLRCWEQVHGMCRCLPLGSPNHQMDDQHSQRLIRNPGGSG